MADKPSKQKPVPGENSDASEQLGPAPVHLARGLSYESGEEKLRTVVEDGNQYQLYSPVETDVENSNIYLTPENSLIDEIKFVRDEKFSVGLDNEVFCLLERSTGKKFSKDSLQKENNIYLRNHLYRVHKVWKLACDVFGDETAALDWFMDANQSLNDMSPTEYLDTPPGIQLVEDVLNKIRFGMVA